LSTFLIGNGKNSKGIRQLKKLKGYIQTSEKTVEETTIRYIHDHMPSSSYHHHHRRHGRKIKQDNLNDTALEATISPQGHLSLESFGPNCANKNEIEHR